MRRPSVHQLEVFCAVVQFESMARAAESFKVSPSSVSMQIQELERRFKTPLLVRSPRKTVPTAAGSVLYRYAESLLRALDEVEREIMALSTLQSGTLRFASGRTIGAAVVRPVLQAFEREHPEIDVAYHVMASSQQATSEVLEGRAEFALLGRFEPDWPIAVKPFFAEPLLVAMAAHHPLASVETLTTDHLASTVLLMREPPVLGHDRVLTELKELGVVPEVVEFGSTEAIKAEVIAGAGLAMLPPTVVEDAVAAGQVTLRTVEGFTAHRTVYLASLPRTPLSPAAEAFVELVQRRRGSVTLPDAIGDGRSLATSLDFKES